MTNLQRLIDKYNLLIFISTIVKNYKQIFQQLKSQDIIEVLS